MDIDNGFGADGSIIGLKLKVNGKDKVTVGAYLDKNINHSLVVTESNFIEAKGNGSSGLSDDVTWLIYYSLVVNPNNFTVNMTASYGNRTYNIPIPGLQVREFIKIFS